MFTSFFDTFSRPTLLAALMILAAFTLASCNLIFTYEPPQAEPTGDLAMQEIRIGRIPGWNADSHGPALSAFVASCGKINARDGRNWFGPTAQFGQVSDWQQVCNRAARLPHDDRTAKKFFETQFRAFAVEGEGTFTGYYEVEVPASRVRTAGYTFPVYRRPADLGQRSPYFTRAQIDQGALAGRGLELMWLQTAADAFLLHVQGSGAVQLTDGTRARLSYAGNNGYDFKSIFGALKAAGYDPAVEGASMVDFRRWLNANPHKAVAAIQANPRFIFFSETHGNGPIGAQGVELTAGRSLAVDDSYFGYGVPLFLNTSFIDPTQGNKRRNLQRLMVAQDTGAAINGKVRGDFFWGTGESALQYAGRMKEKGRYFILLPR